jgi:hypothetical protein
LAVFQFIEGWYNPGRRVHGEFVLTRRPGVRKGHRNAFPIYVAVVDILMEEINTAPVRLPLFVMTGLGFGVMALLAVWT